MRICCWLPCFDEPSARLKCLRERHFARTGARYESERSKIEEHKINSPTQPPQFSVKLGPDLGTLPSCTTKTESHETLNSTMSSITATRTSVLSTTEEPSTTDGPSVTSKLPKVALKTQFAQPTQCSNIFTTSITTYGPSGFQQTYYIVASDQRHRDFASCQAPGWNSLAPEEERFVFNPGVCPSGWTAYFVTPVTTRSTGVGSNSDWTTSTEVYSEAYCCARYVHRSSSSQAESNSILTLQVATNIHIFSLMHARLLWRAFPTKDAPKQSSLPVQRASRPRPQRIPLLSKPTMHTQLGGKNRTFLNSRPSLHS